MQRVQQVTDHLKLRGIEAAGYFANMPDEERMKTIFVFNAPQSEIKVLVATDLASRGIDFADVDLVVQFDFGSNITAIMHRVGRTGRCGKKGRFTSFYRKKDDLLFSKFMELIKGKINIEEVYSHKRSLNKKEKKSGVEKEEDSEI